jgi:hypothetical protein
MESPSGMIFKWTFSEAPWGSAPRLGSRNGSKRIAPARFAGGVAPFASAPIPNNATAIAHSNSFFMRTSQSCLVYSSTRPES